VSFVDIKSWYDRTELFLYLWLQGTSWRNGEK
jgi:hypothetical protein